MGKAFDNLAKRYEKVKSEKKIEPSDLDLYFKVHILTGKYPDIKDNEKQDLLNALKELARRIS